MACAVRNGFACFNGTEIWNTCRTMQYVEDLFPQSGYSLTFSKNSAGEFCCGCCDGLYTTPVDDDAPWVHASFPESEEFYGFFPTLTEGLTFTNPSFAPVTPTRDGAVIGARNDPGRTIEVSMLAFGATCEAVTWGVHWLNSVIETSGGLAWEDCCISEESGESPGDIVTLGRNIPCVYTTAGITTEPFQPQALGGLVQEVTFTLTAERSWIYDAPITLFEDTVWPGGAADNCVDYQPDCLDGAVIEVFVDRKQNTADGTVIVRANPAYFLDDPPTNIDNKNFRYGVSIDLRRGDSVIVDPRCLGTFIIGPTGAPLYPATDVTLIHNALGAYPVIPYGENWWICTTIADNGGGPVSLRVRAWPRRRI